VVLNLRTETKKTAQSVARWHKRAIFYSVFLL